MIYNILDYGAKNDLSFESTSAIQQALDDCAENGGGTVVIPAGNYLIYTLEIKDNTELHFENGARLVAGDDGKRFRSPSKPSNYAGWFTYCLIYAEDRHNVSVTGNGVVDGRRSHTLGYTPEKDRQYAFIFYGCDIVTVRDVTVTNPGYFCFFSLYSQNMTFENVKLLSRNSQNGDGIDFDSCKNVFINNCYFDTDDDAISLKPMDPKFACENFMISNCIMHTFWAAVRLGPESCGDIRNITVTNCLFDHCNDGIKIQPCEQYVIENVTVSNITMQGVLRPFFMTVGTNIFSQYSSSRRPPQGAFRRIFINNVTATMEDSNPNLLRSNCFIYGMPGSDCKDISISDFTVRFEGHATEEDAQRADHYEILDANSYPELLPLLGNYPSACMYIKNIHGISLQNCTFESVHQDPRCAIVAENVSDLSLAFCKERNCAGLLRHHRCDGLENIACKGEFVTLNETQKAIWEETHNIALAVQKKVDQAMAIFEANEKKTPLCKIDTSNPFSVAFDGKEPKILNLSDITSRFDILVDGKKVYSWDLPDIYLFRTMVGVDLTPYLNKGENTVQIVAERPDAFTKNIALI